MRSHLHNLSAIPEETGDEEGMTSRQETRNSGGTATMDFSLRMSN